MMSFLAHKKAAAAAAVPRHVEIWGELEDNNRFLRRVTAASVLWAFVALALGAYGLFVGLYRPLAFHVAKDGQAAYAGRLREDTEPAEVEARYLAKTFFRHYLAFNSETVEYDMAGAMNLMTDKARGEYARQLADFEAKNRTTFVEFIKAQGIQASLELDDKRTEVTADGGKTFVLHVRGKLRTWPLSRIGEQAVFDDKDLDAQVTLVVCPRTEKTPNGLLVHHVRHHVYVAESGQAGKE